ncbi:HIT family protein [Candidatus Woesearchaeota archaeon]|nr:HIT family protein [Candidatus Woesearchaeota archaeon]
MGHSKHHKEWLMKYVHHEHQHPHKHPDCKFCKWHVKKEDILFENPHIIVVMGRAHHKGHLVIATRPHEEHLMLLHPKTLSHFFNDAIKVCRALHTAIKFDRLNLEYLDNWDPHIHWNIYPRFKKDKDWGNPPYIPKKGERFKSQKLTDKEMRIFKRELKKIK